MKIACCPRVVVVFAGVCGVVLACCLLPGLGRRVPADLTYQVKQGMTRDEVHAVLGEPNEREGPPDNQYWGYYTREGGWWAWTDPVYVSFGDDGRVTSRWRK